MNVPTRGETFAKLIEHIRYAQEHAATMSHLSNANDDSADAEAWLKVSENFKGMVERLTLLATRGMQ